MKEKIRIDVPFSTMLKIVLTILLFYFFYVIRDVLLILFIVVILVAGLRPTVNKWAKKIGRTFSVLILLVILLSILAVFIYIIVPPMVDQIRQLASNFPEYIRRFAAFRSQVPYVEKITNTIAQSLGGYAGNFVSFATSVFGGLVTFLLVVVLTIYVLIDDHVFTGAIKSLVPANKRDEVIELVNKLSDKIGDWLRGQLLLCLIMGTLVFAGLSIIRVPYALTLGVLAGLLEMIPIIGPVTVCTLSALVALSIHPITAVIVIVFYIVLHQLEDNLVVPKVMQRVIGLPPAILIISMLVGARLMGLVGTALALPVAGIIYVIFQEWDVIKSIFKNDQKS
ncbi:MAG: AI-2E family transporter [Candidatus Berkelbacteria bacterium]